MLAPAVPPRRIKILTVGDAGVGKSCLIKRHCEGRFVGEYITTIGIDYGVRKWEDSSSPSVVAAAAGSKTDMNFSGSATALNSASESEEVSIHFWDMAGDPAYYDVRNEFYENTDGVLLVFDVGSRRSLENVRDRWLAEMALHLKCDKTEVLSTCQAVLVGNKTDVKTEKPREVTEEEARALATHLGINYVETSAQTGQNVDAMFEDLYRRVLHSNRKNEGGEGHVHVDAGGIGEVKS